MNLPEGMVRKGGRNILEPSFERPSPPAPFYAKKKATMSEDNDDVLSQALQDSTNVPKDEALKSIAKLAVRMIQCESAVDTAELALSQAKEALRQVSEVELPAAMLELGLRKFELNDGAKITVAKVYGANIKVENRPVAFKWLVDNGHEGLIKTNVVTEFGKGERERKEALEFLQSCKEDGFTANLDESVHAQTLKAFVKEQLEANESLPKDQQTIFPECITVFVGEKAKIVLPKKR